MPDYVNIRIWHDTRRMLRLIAAESDEQMVEVMDRLCREECRKLGMNVATNVADTSDTAVLPQHNAEP